MTSPAYDHLDNTMPMFNVDRVSFQFSDAASHGCRGAVRVIYPSLFLPLRPVAWAGGRRIGPDALDRFGDPQFFWGPRATEKLSRAMLVRLGFRGERAEALVDSLTAGMRQLRRGSHTVAAAPLLRDLLECEANPKALVVLSYTPHTSKAPERDVPALGLQRSLGPSVDNDMCA